MASDTSTTIAFSAFHGTNHDICQTATLQEAGIQVQSEYAWKFSETLNKGKDKSI